MTSAQDQLEQIVDRVGLKNVIETLAIICDLKADHILSNWQDSSTASAWQRNTKVLDTAAARIRT
jgi:hypothetical protein